MNNVSIIIPAIQWESFTEQCVQTCNHLYPNSAIIVVLNSLSGVPVELPETVKVLKAPTSIAGKRNIAAGIAKGEYIAFIDSDAYPHPDWLPEAIQSFSSDSAIAIVGGPNVSPPDQIPKRHMVGVVSRSWLVAGKWHFYKSLKSAARFCDNLPSCNMVMRRVDYLALGGMREELEVGEDTDLCARVLADSKKIYFNPKAVVFHFDRMPLDFLSQRLVRGAGIFIHLFGKSAQKNQLYTYLLLQPVFVWLLLFSIPLGWLWDPWFTIVGVILLTYLMIIGIEAMRMSDRLAHFPFIFSLVLCGNLLPGLGFMLRAFRLLPPLSDIYRNDRKAV
jgi:cellulose synthase/poly-beta-1,6-N-acetylglucosamine synthase-like glycosyltransferase